jgi:hypothetical protein
MQRLLSIHTVLLEYLFAKKATEVPFHHTRTFIPLGVCTPKGCLTPGIKPSFPFPAFLSTRLPKKTPPVPFHPVCMRIR